MALVAPLASTMIAPCLPAIESDLGITSQSASQLTISIFLLGYAIGPLLLSPLSELYGRMKMLQACNACFFVFTLAGGSVRSPAQLLAFRFLAGFGGATSLSIGGGVLGDCFSPSELSPAGAIYCVIPTIGPCLGPIVGGFSVQYSTWRWTFWSVAAFDIGVQVAALFLVCETHASTVLQSKCWRPCKETRNTNLYVKSVPSYSVADPRLWRHALVRPFKLLGTQILIQVLALYMAYLTGVAFIIETTFPILWTQTYQQLPAQGSLNYISLGIAYLLAAQACGIGNKWVCRSLSYECQGVTKRHRSTTASAAATTGLASQNSVFLC